MIRSELILRLHEQNPHLYHRDMEAVVSAIFDEITHALAAKDRVELRGFGAFSVRERQARLGRNPRTGANVDVNEKVAPYFKPGKEMRLKLNKDTAKPKKAAKAG
jgi:integration host factor subunit beta